MGTHQFDRFCTSTHRLYFDFFGQALLRPKVYFDLYFSTNKKSRFDKRSKYRGRGKEGEVERSKILKWSKYRKGQTDAYRKLLAKKYAFSLYRKLEILLLKNRKTLLKDLLVKKSQTPLKPENS